MTNKKVNRVHLCAVIMYVRRDESRPRVIHNQVIHEGSSRGENPRHLQQQQAALYNRRQIVADLITKRIINMRLSTRRLCQFTQDAIANVAI